MRYVRRLAAVTVAGLLMGAMLASPASADTPERFVGNAAGRALGLDVLRQSALYAPTFDRKLPQMLARNFTSTNFSTALLLKDLDLIRSEAAELGLDTTALDGARDVVRNAVEAGKGKEDYASLYEVIDPP